MTDTDQNSTRIEQASADILGDALEDAARRGIDSGKAGTDVPLTAPGIAGVVLMDRRLLDRTTWGAPAARLESLETALGLQPGQSLCGALVGPDGQACLKPEGHTEIVGEGWHSGIAWTTSREY